MSASYQLYDKLRSLHLTTDDNSRATKTDPEASRIP